MPATNSSIGTKLIVAGAIVVVVAGMRVASPIIVPFMFAIFLAIVLSPPIHFLNKLGLPNLISIAIVVTALLAVGFVVFAFVGGSAISFTQSSDSYQQKLEELGDQLRERLADQGINISDQAENEFLDSGEVMKYVSYAIQNLNSLAKNSFLILMTTVLLMLEISVFGKKLRALDDADGTLSNRVDLIADNVRRYIAIKTIISIATGILVWIGLSMLGVRYAALWGLISFLLNYIPNIGSLIAAIPAVLVALVESGVVQAIWVVILFVVVNQLLGTFVEPRVQGRGLGLSPLVVFVSLIFWGWVFGPVGMFLSAPLTMTVKIICENDERSRWLAVLLSSRADDESAAPTRHAAKA